MLKKSLRACVTVILALTICATTCINAFAASAKASYISDIVLCSAASSKEAETKLREQSYKLLTSDSLNNYLPEGMYLGYKSTANPDEAITDISAMNMNGRYSFSDYEVLLEKMKEDVSATVKGLIPMITSYRENYNSGAAVAREVHHILNVYYEDDSGKKMGDYLLTCDLDDTTDITKVFMQSNSAFIVNIQQLLFLAGESDADRAWIEKMASEDPEVLIDMYMDSYPTPNRAYRALAADYGDIADTMSLTWNNFYENLSKVKSEYFVENGGVLEFNEKAADAKAEALSKESSSEIGENLTNEQFTEAVDQNAKAAEVFDCASDIALIDYLGGIEYGDGTMLTFFMRDIDEVDETELYTLAYFMGDSLAAQIANVGVQQVVSRTVLDGDKTTKESFSTINACIDGAELISMYDGVDRSLFENGVALTGATVSKYTSSGKDWSEGLFGRIFQPGGEFKWSDYFTFYIAPMLGSFILWFGTHIGNVLLDGAVSKMTVAANADVLTKKAAALGYELIYEAPVYERTGSVFGFLAFGKGSLSSQSMAFRVLRFFKIGFFFLTAVLTVVSIVMLFVTIFSSDETGPAEYSPIPNHIVDTVSTDHGDDYVAYSCVKNLNGSAGDLNNYVGKNGWLVLYYTKDSSAGAPITTNMKVVKGSTNSPLDYENVTMFGEASAINLSSKDYTGVDDTANGTYLYFGRGSVSTAGSVLLNGRLALSAGAGAVFGAIIGALLQKPKRKKESAEA